MMGFGKGNVRFLGCTPFKGIEDLRSSSNLFAGRTKKTRGDFT